MTNDPVIMMAIDSTCGMFDAVNMMVICVDSKMMASPNIDMIVVFTGSMIGITDKPKTATQHMTHVKTLMHVTTWDGL
jgi:hypothetical protein